VEIRSAAEVSAVTESARTIAETAPPVLRAGLLDLASRISAAAQPLTEPEGAAASGSDDWLSQLDARIAAPAHEQPAYAEPSFAEPAYAEPAAEAPYAPAADEDPVVLDWADELAADAPAAPDDAFYLPPTAADDEPAAAAPWEAAPAAEADAAPPSGAAGDDAFYIPPHAGEEPAAEPAPWESADEPQGEPEPWAVAPPAAPEARSDFYAAAPEARSDFYAADPTPELVPAMHIAAEDDAPPPLPEIALFAPAVAPHAEPASEPEAEPAPEPSAAEAPAEPFFAAAPEAAPAPPAPEPAAQPAPTPTAAPAASPASSAAEALASLGAGMGMTVTGRGREGTDAELAEMDVVWMQAGKVVAVFVVDPAPLVEGVLRVSDMLAARPGIQLPFFVVAAEAARAELRVLAHRPTFGRLNPPLADAVRFLGREKLDGALGQVTGFLRYLRPEFIESLAEPLG
jgi:hypothetical protein